MSDKKESGCSMGLCSAAAAFVAGGVATWAICDFCKRRNCGKSEDKMSVSGQWRKIVLLFGPPGAGKGTHGPKLGEEWRLPVLSTGDMLRSAVSKGTEVGLKAKAVIDRGELVDDDIVISIIKDRIKEIDCGWGFILDGFPRTVKQARALDKMLASSNEAVTRVIELHVDEGQLQERICGRYIHLASGRSYHKKFSPPKSFKDKGLMLDDVTGEPLTQRSDDTVEALSKRLVSYREQSGAILDLYSTRGLVVRVDAGQDIEGVGRDVRAAMNKQ